MEDKKKMSSNGFLSRIKYVKNIEIYLLIVFVLILFLVYFFGGGDGAKTVDSKSMTEEEYRLSETLSSIKNVGEVRVMITYDEVEGETPIKKASKVIVVAEGASDMKTKLELIRAVSFALKLTNSQVEVFEMNK